MRVVQLAKLNRAALVGAKRKALMDDMKMFAEKAVRDHGVKGVTAGNLTPAGRFEEDADVPECTRYRIPDSIVEATYGASVEEAEEMDAWDREMARVNATLQKEGVRKGASTSKGTNDPCEVDVNGGMTGSQQTIVNVPHSVDA
jgi:hypothetical protein